jgi:mannosyltransferase OCH1-like enzyme
MQRIPRQIHLINKTRTVPENYAVYVKSIKEHNPSWDVTIYSDDDAETIIDNNMPDLAKMYKSYRLDVQRTDIFRIVVSWLYGGFYMDMDMLCLKSIDPLCEHTLVLAEEVTLPKQVCEQKGLAYDLQVANYMFGTIPRHPFWLDVLAEAIRRADVNIQCEENVLETTGPLLLSDVYHKVKHKYDDITLLQNKDRICMKWCKKISCHFGDFAAHFHLGKWRWERSGNDLKSKAHF